MSEDSRIYISGKSQCEFQRVDFKTKGIKLFNVIIRCEEMKEEVIEDQKEALRKLPALKKLNVYV